VQILRIGDRPIGKEHPPYIIAEAGVHHENDINLAKQYVEKAASAGADAIKFQTYSADRLAAKWAPTYWEGGETQSQYEVFSQRSLLDPEDYRELAEHAREKGIDFLSTPFDEGAGAMLADLDVPAFKIASADITHHPLLRVVSQYGRPVLLSTGAARFPEIKEAVKVVQDEGAPVAILHCNLSYPTPVAEANLGRIRLLRERFPDIEVGYSDHTQPHDTEITCPVAVGLGARIVEKHFTLDRSLPGDDHYHSVDPTGLARLVEECNNAFKMTIPELETTPSEEAARKYARRSIVAKRKIGIGHRIGEQDIDFKRPGTGIPPSRLSEIVNRIAKSEIEEDALIEEKDLE
jgi:sialic acid synthase SpsE